MSLEPYQSAWRQTPPTASLPTEVETMITRIKQSERRRRTALHLCAFNAALALLLTGGILIFRQPIAWNELLPAAALQIALTLSLVTMIRRQHTQRRNFESAGSTVRASAQAGLSNISSEIRSLRHLLYLACLVVPLLALSVGQLIASGKMNTQAALSFALLCALILTVNIAIQWLRYRRALAPQRTRLAHLLASLGEEA